MDKMGRKIYMLHIDAQKGMYSKKLGQGFILVGLLTVLFFGIMISVAVNCPGLPVAVLNFKVEGPFDITSISIAAVIMILYNLFAWV